MVEVEESHGEECRSVRARWRGLRRRGTSVMAMEGKRAMGWEGAGGQREEEEGETPVSGLLSE